jgi:Protein of unknown function
LFGYARDLPHGGDRIVNKNEEEDSASPSQGEPFTVGRNLRWRDVRLPASVSEHDLDAIINSVLTSRWQKTAMVIGTALLRCREHGLHVEDEILHARIQALAESNRIESAGDLRAWRHSEVRLKN